MPFHHDSSSIQRKDFNKFINKKSAFYSKLFFQQTVQTSTPTPGPPVAERHHTDLARSWRRCKEKEVWTKTQEWPSTLLFTFPLWGYDGMACFQHHRKNNVAGRNGVLSQNHEESISGEPHGRLWCIGKDLLKLQQMQRPGLASALVPLGPKPSLVFIRPRNRASVQKSRTMPR